MRRSPVPPLPWFLIGWLLLNIAAVPTRLGQLGRPEAALLWLPQRVLLTGAMALPVAILGLPFEMRTFECPRIQEGWGFMEGGLVLFPLLGLFLFSASFAAAVLAAAFVAAPPERQAASAPEG